MQRCMSGIDLDEVRVVRMDFFSGYSQVHFMTEDDVDKFIEATEKLHVDPGVNPHSKCKTAPVRSISVSKFNTERQRRSFWWATPDLMENGDPNGAQMWDMEQLKFNDYSQRAVNRPRLEECEMIS